MLAKRISKWQAQLRLSGPLRQSFEVHKDDVIRFITYTTFIIIVFLAFPRLKLLAMGALLV